MKAVMSLVCSLSSWDAKMLCLLIFCSHVQYTLVELWILLIDYLDRSVLAAVLLLLCSLVGLYFRILLNLTAKVVYEVVYKTVSPTSSYLSARFHYLLTCTGSFILSSVKTESLGWSKLKDNFLKKNTERNIWAETGMRSRKMGIFDLFLCHE